MNISEYIGQLLFCHDCVIVPDFGGFIANYKPAGFIPDSHIFLPPAKDVVFNCNISTNDGLLINYISNCEGINYSDAYIKIVNFVNLVKTDLNNGKSVVFKGIGTFIKQSENVIFTPDNTINRLIESFGLPILQMPIGADEVSEPIFFIPASENGSIVRKALIAIPVVLVFALLPLKMSKIPVSINTLTNFYNQTTSHQNLLNNPSSLSDVIDKLTETEYALYYSEPQPKKEKSETKIETDSVNTSTLIPVKEAITETKPDKDFKPEIISFAQPNKKYFIIIGSFVEMRRVNIFCNELKSKKFTPQVVKRDGKLRIAVSSYGESAEANKALLEFRQKHPEYPVWLLRI